MKTGVQPTGEFFDALRREKISDEEVKKFVDEAMSGDYNHVLTTCMDWVNVT